MSGMRYRLEAGAKRMLRNPRVQAVGQRAIPQAALRRIADLRDPVSTLASLRASDRELVVRIKDERLTYLTNRKMASLVETSRALDRDGIEGSFLEAGCALGGSSILLATIMGPERTLGVYDVFGMIPPPSDDDPKDVHDRYRRIADGESEGLGGDGYYGYEDDLIEIVRNNFRSYGIEPDGGRVALIEGLVQDTLRPDGPVALAHVDVDWYDPVMTCLERVWPSLVPGGSIVLDDYFDWGGCQKATDEFLARVDGEYELDDSSGSMKITRVAG